MIYLLHASQRIGGAGRAGAQHYLGWCTEDHLSRRIQEHLENRSNVAIVQAFHARHLVLLLTAVIPGATRDHERTLKRRGHYERLCRICNPRSGRKKGWSQQPWLLFLKEPSQQPSPEPRTENGGASSLTNRTGSIGSSLVGPSLGAVTWYSDAKAPRVVATGGMSSIARAPRRPSGAESAGTKLPSSSLPEDDG